ncbi:MAG TPA: hypothetical protein VN026_11570 [Bacteroidia bacterium]|jgi:hypothetical protein|nr:hypothetical protein [Bacteroidia bacterium]
MNLNEENSKPNKNENNPFSLPDGYFGSFSQKMMHKIELVEELKEFKLLSSIDKKSPFITPDNYFAHIEIKNELTAYSKLSSVKNENGFVVPELYFETSANSITTKIELAEELKGYPVLTSIEKQNVFVAPQNYFEGLSHTVRGKMFAGQTEETSVVRILHLVFSKKTAYAIAAMLVISLGLYFYNSGEETVSGDCGTLACMDKKEILKSNQVSNMDEESLMNLVDPVQLSKNLKKASKTSDKKDEKNYVLENADVNDVVDEI